MITAAAIIHNDILYTLPPPARHHDLIWFAYLCNGSDSIACEQGFMTADGYYVNRAEAWSIADAHGQIKPSEYDRGVDVLYSEGVW